MTQPLECFFFDISNIMCSQSGSWLFTKDLTSRVCVCHISIYHFTFIQVWLKSLSKGLQHNKELAYVHLSILCVYIDMWSWTHAINYCELIIHKGAEKMQIYDGAIVSRSLMHIHDTLLCAQTPNIVRSTFIWIKKIWICAMTMGFDHGIQIKCRCVFVLFFSVLWT